MNSPSVAVAMFIGGVIATLVWLGIHAIAACILGARREKRLAVRCQTQTECAGCKQLQAELRAARLLARDALQECQGLRRELDSYQCRELKRNIPAAPRAMMEATRG